MTLTLDRRDGVCFMHPKRLLGIRKEGNSVVEKHTEEGRITKQHIHKINTRLTWNKPTEHKINVE